MHKAALLATLLWCGSVAAFANECPKSLITLAPSLTELVFEAGAGDCLVGVVAYSDWPEAAQALPVIGDAFQYDLERIVNLAPDHALAWEGGSPPARVAQLEALGVDVTWIGVYTLDDIPRALATIGTIAGDTGTARAAAERFSARRAALEAPADAARARVFYQVSRQPLFTLGARHVITDVIERCGAENIFSSLDQEAAVIDFEAVLATDPDIIIAGAAPGEREPLAAWRQFPRLKAVANDRLYTIDPDLLVRPTSRILEGMEWLCRKVERITRPGSDQRRDPPPQRGGPPSGSRSRK